MRTSHGLAALLIAAACCTYAINTFAQPGGGGAPACCKYNYSWPNGEEDCGGTSATACESSSTGAGITDVLSRKTHLLRWAQCYTYNLGFGEYFARVPCDAPPCTFATIVGARSDETCCRACGVGGWETPVITLQGFKVYDCAGQCDEDID